MALKVTLFGATFPKGGLRTAIILFLKYLLKDATKSTFYTFGKNVAKSTFMKGGKSEILHNFF
jgi:hypothetical protein